MEYNINTELIKIMQEVAEAKEAYDKAKGKLEYIQSIAKQLNEENTFPSNIENDSIAPSSIS